MGRNMGSVRWETSLLAWWCLLLLGKGSLCCLSFTVGLHIHGLHDTLLLSREVADEASVELWLCLLEFYEHVSR